MAIRFGVRLGDARVSMTAHAVAIDIDIEGGRDIFRFAFQKLTNHQLSLEVFRESEKQHTLRVRDYLNAGNTPSIQLAFPGTVLMWLRG